MDQNNSQFNEDFIKNYNEESDEEYFLDVDIQNLEKFMNFMMIYHLYLKD